MKASDYPVPGSKAFNGLGPEARRLSRMVHNTTPLRGETKTGNQTLDRFTEEA